MRVRSRSASSKRRKLRISVAASVYGVLPRRGGRWCSWCGSRASRAPCSRCSLAGSFPTSSRCCARPGRASSSSHAVSRRDGESRHQKVCRAQVRVGLGERMRLELLRIGERHRAITDDHRLDAERRGLVALVEVLEPARHGQLVHRVGGRRQHVGRCAHQRVEAGTSVAADETVVRIASERIVRRLREERVVLARPRSRRRTP